MTEKEYEVKDRLLHATFYSAMRAVEDTLEKIDASNVKYEDVRLILQVCHAARKARRAWANNTKDYKRAKSAAAVGRV